MPAADDAAVARLYAGGAAAGRHLLEAPASQGRAPGYLWTHAYRILGYDAGELHVSGGP